MFDVVDQGHARTIYARLFDIANTRVSTSVSMPMSAKSNVMKLGYACPQVSRTQIHLYLIQNPHCRPFSKQISLAIAMRKRERALAQFGQMSLLEAQSCRSDVEVTVVARALRVGNTCGTQSHLRSYGTYSNPTSRSHRSSCECKHHVTPILYSAGSHFSSIRPPSPKGFQLELLRRIRAVRRCLTGCLIHARMLYPRIQGKDPCLDVG
jgi:hypothetical protein